MLEAKELVFEYSKPKLLCYNINFSIFTATDEHFDSNVNSIAKLQKSACVYFSAFNLKQVPTLKLNNVRAKAI